MYIFKQDWKPITGFEDYLISSVGCVLSYKRGDWRELHPYIGKNGYAYVNLRRDGETIRYNIHRLVAENFIPNPLNKPAVNHIDGNKLNNSVENLEWATYRENSRHAIEHGLTHIPDPAFAKEANRTPIVAIDPNTGWSKKYRSQRDAANELGITPPHINKVLKGECPHAMGYIFEYIDEEDLYDD